MRDEWLISATVGPHRRLARNLSLPSLFSFVLPLTFTIWKILEQTKKIQNLNYHFLLLCYYILHLLLRAVHKIRDRKLYLFTPPPSPSSRYVRFSATSLSNIASQMIEPRTRCMANNSSKWISIFLNNYCLQ